ncbi:hypothetical protein K3495_g2019 [Podosphaera aphanis]|nr:hypothetical protein K3495_g2019 [Podosphaera aphanis]
MPQDYNNQLEAFLLSRNNYEKWFRTFKFKAQSKGYFYVAETTKENFAWIGRAGGSMTSGTYENKNEGSSKSQENESKNKAETFDQDTAKIFSRLTKFLGDGDQETFEEFTSAKEIWDHLGSKYCRTNESTVSTYMSKIQSFPENFDVENEDIEKAWAKLNSYKRKLTAADTGMRYIYPARALFLILTEELPSIYISIIDDFRTNPSTTIDERINILLEKEDSLRSLEHVHPACKQRPQQGRRYSDVSMPDAPVDLLCYRNGYIAQEDSDASTQEETDEETSSSGSDSDHLDTQKVTLSKALISKSPLTYWVLNTGATSPMTDQIHLFRGPLKRIGSTTIQVGRGVLKSDHRGTAIVKCADGSSGLVKKAYYVPNLGVNLLSAKQLCKTGMKGVFDENNIWIKDGNKKMIHATQSDGLYIVKHIAANLKGLPFNTRIGKQNACPAVDKRDNSSFQKSDTRNDTEHHGRNLDLSDKDIDQSDDDPAKTKEERARHRLIHRHFAHYGPDIIGNLHKTSSIPKVKIPIAAKRICKSCKIGKMKNKFSRILAPHKKEPLELISFYIAGPLPISLRDQAITKLRKFRVREELQKGRKLKSTRSDNAPELKYKMEQWEREDGVVANFTVIASSHQNGPAERSIQTAEMSIRTMIDDAELPIEFWDEPVEYDSYVRNRLPLGPTLDGKLTSPIEVYTGVKPNIDHIRPWGYKAYGYVNPKTLDPKGRHDKLIDKIVRAFFTVITAHKDDNNHTLPAKVVNGVPIPRTYKEAVDDKEEHILPDGANIVSTKWVFTVKLKSDGTIERYKARLVARGFSQQYGIDYHETFAPTIRMDTLRLFLLALVAKFDFECHHYDIKNAFTESTLNEEIYLAPPEGVQVSKGKVLKALRSIYGLKQAGRDWSLLLKKFLLSIDFQQSLADPCLYVHPKKSIWIFVYVDDIAAAGTATKRLNWFLKRSLEYLTRRIWGRLRKFLAFES